MPGVNLANSTARWSQSDFVLDQNCILFVDFYNAEGEIYRANFYVAASAVALLALATVLLNLSVLVTVLRTPKQQTATNVYICGLAISDLCTGLVTMPAFAYLLVSLANDQIGCDVMLAATAVAFFAFLLTLFSLALITTERFIAMFYPFFYASTFNSRRVAIKLVMLSIVVAVLIAAGSIFSKNFIAFEIIFPGVCSVTIPWCLYVNWRALKMVVKLNEGDAKRRAALDERNLATVSTETRGSSAAPTMSSVATKRNRKAARLTLILVFAMLLCYGPELVVKMYSFIADGTADVVQVIRTWSQLFVMLNSMLNPLLYCWQLQGFRRDIFRTLTCGDGEQFGDSLSDSAPSKSRQPSLPNDNSSMAVEPTTR